MSAHPQQCCVVQGHDEDGQKTTSALRTTKLLRSVLSAFDIYTRTYPIASAASFLAMENASTFPLRWDRTYTFRSAPPLPLAQGSFEPHPEPRNVACAFHAALLRLLPSSRAHPARRSCRSSRHVHHRRHRRCSRDDGCEPGAPASIYVEC